MYNHPQLIKYEPKVSFDVLTCLKYTVQERKYTSYFLTVALSLVAASTIRKSNNNVSYVSYFLLGMGNNPNAIVFLFQPKQIRISAKTGIPLHVLPQKGFTAKQVERMQMINDGDLPKVSTQPRSKNESKEDKRARKQAVKEERKVKDLPQP